jgi:hypothetical protein
MGWEEAAGMTGPRRPDDDEPLQPSSDEAPDEYEALDQETLDEAAIAAEEELEDEEAIEEAEDVDATEAALTAAASGAALPKPGRADTEPLAAATQRGPTDELPYVDDPISKIFVASMVVVFSGIFIYALLFGKAGALTPEKTRAPSPSPAPSVSISVGPTESPGESPSESPGESPSESPRESPTESPGGSPTSVPTGSPGASPSASPPGGSPSPTAS